MILALLSSVVFIGITGLAVDYGNAVMLEAKLKSATDIATLAGIQEVPYNSNVEHQVIKLLDENYSFADELQVVCGSDDESCWTTTSHEVPTYFMRYFGQNSLTINARARAILEPIDGMSGNPGIMPFVLLNPNKNNDPNDDLVESNNGEPYVLKYGPHNTMIEDWFFGRQIVADGVVHGGNGVGVGDDSSADEEIVSDTGWRDALGLDPNSDDIADGNDSGADYETNLGEGWDGDVNIGDFLHSNWGNMTIPTERGRDERLEDDMFTDWDNFDPNLDPTNPRIVIVPIVSLGNVDESGEWQESGPGDIVLEDYENEYSRVDGFAAFYLLTEDEQIALPGGDEVDRKWAIGRFLYGVNIGGDISSPEGDSGLDLGMFQGRLIPF